MTRLERNRKMAGRVNPRAMISTLPGVESGRPPEEPEGAHRNGSFVRSVLTFRNPDGQVYAEVLGRNDDFAELVDPDDGSVRHDGPFVMYGREWQIESVRVTEDLIRVTCVSTSPTVNEARRRSKQRGWSLKA
jgi:hypothetical protein